MRAAAQLRAEQVAVRRGGVLRACDLRSAMISPDAAERAVATGHWQRPARAIYIPHGRPLSALELGQAAAVYAAAPHLITGLVALHLLELRWLPALGCAHVLVPDRVRRASSDRVQLLRTKEWVKLTSWSKGGLRLAAAERAVVDAARSARSLQEARAIVLGAVADRHATAAELALLVDAGQRNGSGLARRAVRDAARGCASPPEAELVDQLVGCGEPFLVNPELWVRGELVGSPDVWLLNRNVGGEVESVEFHGSDEQAESTYDRHERFAAAGVPLVHLSVRRVRDRPPAAGRWLLAQAALRQVAAPPELRVVPRGPVLR